MVRVCCVRRSAGVCVGRYVAKARILATVAVQGVASNGASANASLPANYYGAVSLCTCDYACWCGRCWLWVYELGCKDYIYPVVSTVATLIWKDFWSRAQNVTEAERARLLQRTTAWKQKRWLQPVGSLYHAVEWFLGQMRLADNLVVVLRRV